MCIRDRVTPSLTAVDLPRIEAGRLAVEVLNAVLSDATPEREGRDARHVLLPARLVVRRSTASPSEVARTAEAARGSGPG